MEVKGRKVLVFGAGISGIGAAGLLEANGADVILYDGNEKLDPASLKEQLGEKKRRGRTDRKTAAGDDHQSGYGSVKSPVCPQTFRWSLP